MLARRSAAEVLARHQDRSTLIAWFVQRERRIGLTLHEKAPVVEQKFSEARALNPLQKLLGNNLIRVDVGSIERCDEPCVNAKWSHDLCDEYDLCDLYDLFVFPLPHVDKMSRNGGGRGHRRTNEMRAATASLPSFEVTIAG